jgi:hypothetical protein
MARVIEALVFDLDGPLLHEIRESRPERTGKNS